MYIDYCMYKATFLHEHGLEYTIYCTNFMKYSGNKVDKVSWWSFTAHLEVFVGRTKEEAINEVWRIAKQKNVAFFLVHFDERKEKGAMILLWSNLQDVILVFIVFNDFER